MKKNGLPTTYKIIVAHHESENPQTIPKALLRVEIGLGPVKYSKMKEYPSWLNKKATICSNCAQMFIHFAECNNLSLDGEPLRDTNISKNYKPSSRIMELAKEKSADKLLQKFRQKSPTQVLSEVVDTFEKAIVKPHQNVQLNRIPLRSRSPPERSIRQRTQQALMQNVIPPTSKSVMANYKQSIPAHLERNEIAKEYSPLPTNEEEREFKKQNNVGTYHHAIFGGNRMNQASNSNPPMSPLLRKLYDSPYHPANKQQQRVNSSRGSKRVAAVKQYLEKEFLEEKDIKLINTIESTLAPVITLPVVNTQQEEAFFEDEFENANEEDNQAFVDYADAQQQPEQQQFYDDSFLAEAATLQGIRSDSAADSFTDQLNDEEKQVLYESLANR